MLHGLETHRGLAELWLSAIGMEERNGVYQNHMELPVYVFGAFGYTLEGGICGRYCVSGLSVL
jgi:hypothetical protein